MWTFLDKWLGDRALGAERSGKWASVRASYIALHPNCAVCGTKSDCEVHHKVPFHINKMLELREHNLITLCRDHHYLIGHLMSWRSYNIDVERDATMLQDKIKHRP